MQRETYLLMVSEETSLEEIEVAAEKSKHKSAATPN